MADSLTVNVISWGKAVCHTRGRCWWESKDVIKYTSITIRPIILYPWSRSLRLGSRLALVESCQSIAVAITGHNHDGSYTWCDTSFFQSQSINNGTLSGIGSDSLKPRQSMPATTKSTGQLGPPQEPTIENYHLSAQRIKGHTEDLLWDLCDPVTSRWLYLDDFSRRNGEIWTCEITMFPCPCQFSDVENAMKLSDSTSEPDWRAHTPSFSTWNVSRLGVPVKLSW